LKKLIKGPFKVDVDSKGSAEIFLERLQKIPILREGLQKEAESVDALFQEWFGIEAATTGKQCTFGFLSRCEVWHC
jgi:hypothetical protein